MQQQQQLQWSAACQWVLGWMGGGGGGEGGEGVCGRGSVGVRQLMVRAPAGHTGASRWRTSEPPHSSTKTLPTLAPCSCFQPKSLSLLSAFQLSLSLYHCLAPFSLLPLSFSFYSFLVQLIKIQIHLLFVYLLLSHRPLYLRWQLSDCVLSTFSPEGFVFLHMPHSLHCLS